MIGIPSARRLTRYGNPEGKGILPAGRAVRRRDQLAGQKPFSTVTRKPRPCLGSGPNTRQLSRPGPDNVTLTLPRFRLWQSNMNREPWHSSTQPGEPVLPQEVETETGGGLRHFFARRCAAKLGRALLLIFALIVFVAPNRLCCKEDSKGFAIVPKSNNILLHLHFGGIVKPIIER